MHILYVAKHDSGGNDDEGAVAYSLRKLGHEVECVQERYATTHGLGKFSADLLLCHHWRDLYQLATFRGPKVMWSFDLVSWPEPRARHAERERWAGHMADLCDLCFFTDGDHVAKDTTGKLHWLTQGADERPCVGTIDEHTKYDKRRIAHNVDVLFVGSIGYGREQFIHELRERYGERFKHVLKGCHGSALADEVNRAKIVVCPDTPVTDRYWSNRVYNLLRLGAFVLHPYCERLATQYPGELFLYHSREMMHQWIGEYLQLPTSRDLRATTNRVYTMNHHTYTHRCAELLRVVKEKLNVS